MREVQRIDEQMRRAFEGGAWHGPAVREVLSGMTADRAARRPIGKAHSIWEIVLHMATWKAVVARRLRGDPVTEVPPEVDFPSVKDTGEAAWAAALARLEETHADLRRALADVADDELDQPPPSGKTPRYTQLHGIIQHDLYHAGQIAVLAKG